MNGGIMPMDENFGDMPSVWATYFSVADIDATAAAGSARHVAGSSPMPRGRPKSVHRGQARHTCR